MQHLRAHLGAPERAGAEELAALVRNRSHIGNRLHCVRDFTCDEDRCRALPLTHKS